MPIGKMIEDKGEVLFVAGLIGLGLTDLAFRDYSIGLFPRVLASPTSHWASVIHGIALLLAAILAWRGRSRGTAGLLIAIVFFLPLLLLHPRNPEADLTSPVSWVAPTECALLGITGILVARHGAWRVHRIVCGSALLVFASVHLVEQQAIASLIPAWMPGRGTLPLLTGSFQALSGIALLAGVLVRPVAMLVALMFMSWLPLVHVQRLVTAPDSSFEWTFAATAIALAGAILLAGRNARPALQPGSA